MLTMEGVLCGMVPDLASHFLAFTEPKPLAAGGRPGTSSFLHQRHPRSSPPLPYHFLNIMSEEAGHPSNGGSGHSGHSGHSARNLAANGTSEGPKDRKKVRIA
jgi:hypothetical protein